MNHFHDSEKSQEAIGIDLHILDSKRLQMFYLAMKEGSYVSAAQKLGLSPSAVSHSLKHLEEELNCSLFTRKGAHMEPTSAGIKLLPMVEKLLQQITAVKSEIHAFRGGAAHLAFSIPLSFQERIHHSVYSVFRECFPSANLKIFIQDSNEPKNNSRKLDFKIDAIERVPEKAMRRNLFTEELGLYIAPFHELGNTSRVSPKELQNQWLISTEQSTLEDLNWKYFSGMHPQSKHWIIPCMTHAKQIAKKGQGIVILPSSHAELEMKEKSLIQLNLTGDPLLKSYCAWWLYEQPLSWISEVFLDLLTQNDLSS